VRPPLRAADQRPERPDGFHIRAASFQPVRSAYVRQVLVERLGLDPHGRRALVVGSGRGLLARELARLGFAVTGLDPAASAVRLARDETAREGLSVDHEVGDPHHLAYPDQAFDVAYYADTLEITPDLDRVVAEAARVLRHQGVFVYDTVNRTALSRLIYLGALQSWPGTRVMPRHRYAWDRLRPPAELAATLGRHGLRNQDVRGFLPASPQRLVRATLRARRGGIGDPELADLAGMHLAPEGKRPPVTYLGFAVKERSTP
jgi:2-polyprenyl-6-hydroxyphenyl methylase / 3-demethylubiquinone-9 3-methyltransferase